MNLLGLSGSLRSDSSNTRLLQAAKSLCPINVKLEIEEATGHLPHFNPDVSAESDSSVLDFVARVRQCDGLVVSSPVYAGGYPGTLKNALDWLVNTDAFVDKPFMMLSASNRVPGVEKTLVSVLETMSGVHIQNASTTVPLLGKTLTSAQIVKDDEMRLRISSALEDFFKAISSRNQSSREFQ